MQVFAYYTPKKKLLSVKALEGRDKGRIVMHVDQLQLKNVEFTTRGKTDPRVGAVGELVAVWGAELAPHLANSTVEHLAIGKFWHPLKASIGVYYSHKQRRFTGVDGKAVTKAARVQLDNVHVIAEQVE